jgi:DNA-binding CsgD family transcriptional regulator
VTRLIEREDELARLTELLTACTRGVGGLAVVSGAVGIGKTALLRALSEQAAGAGWWVLTATGVQSERAVSLGVVGELFRSVELPADTVERVTGLLDEASAEARARADASVSAPADAPFETAGLVGSRALHGLFAVLRELSAAAPVVLIVDDVHHADPASLQSLLYVVRRAWAVPILVVFAESEHPNQVNPVFRTELLREPRCTWLRLDRLSTPGVRELCGECCEATTVELATVSGGNPLLVRALLADQRADWPDAGGRDGSEWLSPTPTPLAVGTAFRQAVTACMYRVEPTMLAAARWLALLGKATAVASLAELLEVGLDEAARAVHNLENAGLLTAGWFRHPAAAAAVLDGMTGEERRHGHRRIAQLLQDEGVCATEVARHLVAANVHDEWALPVLCEAAEQAGLRNDIDFCTDCLKLATQACVTPVQRAAVTMNLVRVQWRVNPAAAAKHLEPLTVALFEGHLTADDAAMLARALLWHGRLSAAADVLAHAAATGNGDREGPAAKLLATQNWMRSVCPSSLPPLPETSTTPNGAAVATVSPFDQSLRAITALTHALTKGADDDSIAISEHVLQGSHLDDDSLDSIESALLTLVYADRSDRAARWCVPMLEQAHAKQARTWQARLAAVRAEIAMRQGDLPAAQRWARKALSYVPRRGWGVVAGTPLAILVLTKTMLGKLDEAGEQLDLAVPQAMAQTRYGLLYRYARGHYHLAMGRWHAALTDFLACGEQMRKWDIDLPAFVPWRTGAATAHLSLGQPELARHLAEEQLTRPGSTQPHTHGMTLRVLAAASPSQHRPRMLWRAAEILRDSGDRLELSRTLADLSVAHETLGESTRSRVLAQQALQLAQECQIEPLIQAMLRGSGASEDEPAATGPEPTQDSAAILSEAERRVASLVALGHTNREVAQTLFITISTVEQHLTRVYRKLNVSGRADLSVCLELNAAPGMSR